MKIIKMKMLYILFFGCLNVLLAQTYIQKDIVGLRHLT